MQSMARDVATYLEEVPADRRACLTRLRQLCRATLAGYEECIEYGMPCYKKDGVAEVAFASQKNHIALYVMKTDVVEGNRDRLAGLSVGKGCIRYTRPEKMDFDVVERLLAGTAASTGGAC